MRLELEADRWQVINDGVMGGLSRSQVIQHGRQLIFRGNLSLQNNGGFASARCRFSEDFSAVTGFRLTLRGDGRRYQFRLRADESSDGVAWRAEFVTGGANQRVDLPLSAFVPVIRGRKISQPCELKPADVHLLGFMLADGRPGPFALEVHAIEAREDSGG